MFLNLIFLISLAKLVESQTPQIDFGFGFDEIILGSNLNVPILFNQNKPLGSQTKLQCLIQQFSTTSDYDNFAAKITSSFICPSNIYTGIKSISILSTSQGQSDLTYDKKGFNWYFNDTIKDSKLLYILNEFVFQGSALNYIAVERFPFNSLKIDFTTYLSIFCCDSTYLNNAVPTGQFVYSNKITRFIITVPSGLDSSLKFPTVPTTNDLLDPSYKPCNCDLTLNACDLNCCCDSSCTDDDKKTFNIACLNAKNFTSREIEESFCDDIYSQPKLNRSSWFPILCIHSSLTVLLGKFYLPNALDSIDFNSDQYKQKRDSSYNIKSAYLDLNSTVKTSRYCNLDYKNDYSVGICLKKKLSSDSTPSDFIRLPDNSLLTSTCVYDSPVRYLVDKKSFCPITITQSSCNNENIKLNINQYLLKDILIDNPKIENKVDVKLEVYECSFEQLFQMSSTSGVDKLCNNIKFSSKSQIFDNSIDGLCTNYNWTYDSKRINNIPIDFFLSFDYQSKCTLINSNSYNTPIFSNNVCQNSVASVRNIFIWSGGTIQKVLQRIIVIQNAMLNTPFNQYFETKWEYNTDFISKNVDSVTKYDDYLTTLIGDLKSGVNGYINGKPLISGYTSDSTNTLPNINYNYRISHFKTLNGKLCGTNSNLERKIINFNQNETSTCIIQLTRNDLTDVNNCNALRKIIFNKLNDYFAPSNIISKNGNPNMDLYNASQWINLFPSSRYLDLKDSIAYPDKCPNIPYKMNIYFFYTPVSKINNLIASNITGAYITYSLRNWTFTCKSNLPKCNSQDYVEDFEIQFESLFINTYSKNMTWFEKCKEIPGYSQACLQQVFFTWPNDPTNPDYYNLYANHLGLLFGVFSFIIIYVMIIGFVCPC